MAQILNQGQVNLASLAVDDVYVIVVPPGPQIIRGVPTAIAGIVGTASWGPKNAVIQIGSPQESLNLIGPVNNSQYDIATALALANLSGANDFRVVRVTDGNDTAATLDIDDNAAAALVTLTAKHTGSFGNNIKCYVENGSKGTGYYRISINLQGSTLPREIFDNIPAGAAVANLKANIVAAINSGQGAIRPPSSIVTAASGAGTGTIELKTDTPYTASGGADGSSSADDDDVIGSASSVTGMYRLENSGAFQFICMGVDDPTKWGTIISFAKKNGMLAVIGFATGTSSSSAVSAKQTNGVDDYAAMLAKDHILWDDPVNKVRRLIPPEAAALGLIAIQSPEQGVGNKPIFGIAGTERTQAQQPYTDSEIATLTSSGINFFTNPIPAGNQFGLRHNQNASSDRTVDGVNYTRMTNFLARSFATSLGRFIGRTQSTSPNDQTRADARATLASFLNKLKQPIQLGGAGMIDEFNLILDESNNTPQSIGEGYLNAYIQVRYLAVVRFFTISLQGGQTVVTVAETSTGN